MLLTIDLDIENSKAKAFIDFLRTLDYIKIREHNDLQDFVLSEKHKEILDERKQSHISGKSKSFNWSDLQNELRSSEE